MKASELPKEVVKSVRINKNVLTELLKKMTPQELFDKALDKEFSDVDFKTQITIETKEKK